MNRVWLKLVLLRKNVEAIEAKWSKKLRANALKMDLKMLKHFQHKKVLSKLSGATAIDGVEVISVCEFLYHLEA